MSAAASAADLPAKAPYVKAMPEVGFNWTGLYVGLNAGGGSAHNCWDMNGAFIVGFNPALHEGCNDATGAIVGGQIGYRQQFGTFVFGIEAQGDWANLKGSNQSAIFNGLPPGLINLTNTTKVDGIGMFTGQVGYSFGSVLWYVKGGAAVTDNEYTGALSIPAIRGLPSPLLTDSAKEVRFGGVVGTGLEWAFAPGWSIGAEYNHLFMDNRDVGFALTNAPLIAAGGVGLLGAGSPSRHDTISQDVDLATVKLNYKFAVH
jgi:outer membrane immunogenic protein